MAQIRLTSTLTLLAYLAAFSVSHLPSAWAVPHSKEEAEIPKAPSAPIPLKPTEPPDDAFRCARYLVYKGKRMDCDSNVRRDAERIRPILESVPSAVTELNIYQANRRSIRTSAYLASLGIVAVLVGMIIGSPGVSKQPGGAIYMNNGVPQVNTGGYIALGGLLLGVNSFIYGASLIRTNEDHLDRALELYNQAKPQDPLQIQVSTGFQF